MLPPKTHWLMTRTLAKNSKAGMSRCDSSAFHDKQTTTRWGRGECLGCRVPSPFTTIEDTLLNFDFTWGGYENASAKDSWARRLRYRAFHWVEISTVAMEGARSKISWAGSRIAWTGARFPNVLLADLKTNQESRMWACPRARTHRL